MPDLALRYDDLAETYAAGRHRFDTTPILREFAGPLPPGARVLDAGCGAGEPVARYFIERASRDSAGVGLATVYRALKAFMVRGEIAQVEIPGTAPRDRRTPRPARAPRSRSFAGHETLT